jgi:hypothetical protein
LGLAGANPKLNGVKDIAATAAVVVPKNFLRENVWDELF